jgi:hypothetical protein
VSDENAAASFDPLRPRMMRIAYRMLRSIADAEDVVQDAFQDGRIVAISVMRNQDKLRDLRGAATH